MSRYARRRDPAVRPKTRLELSDEHVALRIICVVVCIAVAALAFGAVLNNLLSVQTGWQQIEPADPQTGIAQDFLLCYNIGQSDSSPREELRAVSSIYSSSSDQAYRVLANVELEGYVNLWTLNSQPNTDITVDSLTYNAFAQIQESGSRLPYFAPLVRLYQSLFGCTYDQEAENLDPARSPEQEAFAREIAAFANSADAVEVVLLPDCQVRLAVSEEYLAYAAENEVDSFVDFGILLNALICDAVADELEARGYTAGYVTSFDGFTRALCTDEFGLNVFDIAEGKTYQLGTALYNSPGAVVSCRSFPILDKDSVNYYTYDDGTVLAPYLNEQGLLHTACASLNTFSAELNAVRLALRTLEAYAGEDSSFPTLEGISWIGGKDLEIIQNGPGFRLAE